MATNTYFEDKNWQLACNRDLCAVDGGTLDFSAAAANSKKNPGVVLPAGDPRALLSPRAYGDCVQEGGR